MKLGESLWIDVLACFGVGAAAAGTLVLAYLSSSRLSALHTSVLAKNALSVGIYGFVMISQISLMALLGATRELRVENSSVGYVAGAAASLLLAWVMIRAKAPLTSE